MYLSACRVRCARPRTTPGPGKRPTAGLGHAEAGRLVGDDEVADHRQLAAAAERVAVDGGDRRLRDLLDRAERARAPPGRTRGGRRRRRARRSPRCRRRPRSTSRRRGRSSDADGGVAVGLGARGAASSEKKPRVIAFSFSGRSSVSQATRCRVTSYEIIARPYTAVDSFSTKQFGRYDARPREEGGRGPRARGLPRSAVVLADEAERLDRSIGGRFLPHDTAWPFLNVTK